MDGTDYDIKVVLCVVFLFFFGRGLGTGVWLSPKSATGLSCTWLHAGVAQRVVITPPILRLLGLEVLVHAVLRVVLGGGSAVGGEDRVHRLLAGVLRPAQGEVVRGRRKGRVDLVRGRRGEVLCRLGLRGLEGDEVNGLGREGLLQLGQRRLQVRHAGRGVEECQRLLVEAVGAVQDADVRRVLGQHGGGEVAGLRLLGDQLLAPLLRFLGARHALHGAHQLGALGLRGGLRPGDHAHVEPGAFALGAEAHDDNIADGPRLLAAAEGRGATPLELHANGHVLVVRAQTPRLLRLPRVGARLRGGRGRGGGGGGGGHGGLGRH
eukprot:Rhum_TRINITY_DN14266_c10_g2::Rhum_TRINITY_DN14266_c10_g2_i1::g.78916::m.78916